MKKNFIALIIALAISFHSYAQWTTSGSNIYYPTGNVGIGNPSPTAFLDVIGATEQLRLGADANNYAKFIVSQTGGLTITPTGTTTTLTGSLIAGFSTSNLYIGTAGGAITTAAAGYQFSGSANTYIRTGVGGATSAPLATAHNYSTFNVAASPFNLSASVNIPFAASAVINPVGAISLGSGSSVTNTATLYIDGANTQGTNNYALYSYGPTAVNYFGGYVAINTPSMPAGYQFAVNGNMVATAVTVKLYNNWPDYVFNKGYRLAPLSSIKTYVDQNHHLPGMPSAGQISTDGLNLGEINKLLVKKVEELTLYMVEKDEQIRLEQKKEAEQDKKLNAQQAQLSAQQAELDKLSRQLEQFSKKVATASQSVKF